MHPKIAITGAAGLVGQNLIPRLKARGYGAIVAIDKHPANTAILRRLHPDITIIEADLATQDGWQGSLSDADVIVVSHAQIGGLDPAAFTANNVTATERLLDVLGKKPGRYLVHISSSVVNSAAEDCYTESKEAQAFRQGLLDGRYSGRGADPIKGRWVGALIKDPARPTLRVPMARCARFASTALRMRRPSVRTRKLSADTRSRSST